MLFFSRSIFQRGKLPRPDRRLQVSLHISQFAVERIAYQKCFDLQNYICVVSPMCASILCNTTQSHKGGAGRLSREIVGYKG